MRAWAARSLKKQTNKQSRNNFHVYDLKLLFHPWYPSVFRCSARSHSNLIRISQLVMVRRRRQQERHKFAYLTMKNNSFAHFARAFFNFGHFADVLVLSTTWNQLFCSCVDDVTMRWKMFNFVLSLKRWFQFNSRIVKTHLASVMTLNDWAKIAETRSNIWCSRCHRRSVRLNSLTEHTRSLNVLSIQQEVSHLRHPPTPVAFCAQLRRKTMLKKRETKKKAQTKQRNATNRLY